MLRLVEKTVMKLIIHSDGIFYIFLSDGKKRLE